MASITTTVDTDGVSGDYSSLALAEAGEVATYDDLVSDGNTITFYCQATTGTADTAQVQFRNWTTGSNNYILIEGSDFPSDGKWDASKYVLHLDDDTTYGINIEEAYCRVNKLQVLVTATNGSRYGINANDFGSQTTTDIRVERCIVKGVCSGTGGARGIYIDDTEISNAYIYNCLVYDFVSGTDSEFKGIESRADNTDFFNCTVHNCRTGIEEGGSGTHNAKNCVVFGCNDDFDGSITIDYCATDSGEGSNDQTPSGGDWDNEFTDYPNDDFTLKSGGNLVGGGTDNPSSGIYLDDITEKTRTSTWDIGVYEYIDPLVTLDSYDAIHQSITNFFPVIAFVILLLKDTIHQQVVNILNLIVLSIVSSKDAIHQQVTNVKSFLNKFNLSIKSTIHQHIVNKFPLVRLFTKHQYIVPGVGIINDDSIRTEMVIPDSGVYAQRYSGSFLSLVIRNTIHQHIIPKIKKAVSLALNLKDTIHQHVANVLNLTVFTSLFIRDTIHQQISKISKLFNVIILDLNDSLHQHIVNVKAFLNEFALSSKDSLHQHMVDVKAFLNEFILASKSTIHQHISSIRGVVQQVVLLILNAIHLNIGEVWKAILNNYTFAIKNTIHKHFSPGKSIFYSLLLNAKSSIHKNITNIVALIKPILDKIISYIIPGGGIVNDQELEIDTVIPELGIYNQPSLYGKVKLRIVNAIHSQVTSLKNLFLNAYVNVKNTIHQQMTQINGLLGRISLAIKSIIHNQITNIQNLLLDTILLSVINTIHNQITNIKSVIATYILSTKVAIHQHISKITSVVDGYILFVRDTFNKQISEVMDVYEGAILFIRNALHRVMTVEKHEGVNTFNLDWDAVLDPDLEYYKVFWGTTLGGPYPNDSGDLGDVLTYEITLPNDGQTWYIVVKAYDTNDFESDASDELSKTTTAGDGSLRSNLRLFLNLINFTKSSIHKQIVTPFSLSAYNILIQTYHALHEHVVKKSSLFLTELFLSIRDSFQGQLVSKPLGFLIGIVLNSIDAFNKQISEIKLNANKIIVFCKDTIIKQLPTMTEVLSLVILLIKTLLHKNIPSDERIDTFGGSVWENDAGWVSGIKWGHNRKGVKTNLDLLLRIKQTVNDAIHQHVPTRPFEILLSFLILSKDVIHRQITVIKAVIINLLEIFSKHALHQQIIEIKGIINRSPIISKRTIHKQIAQKRRLVLRIKQIVNDALSSQIISKPIGLSAVLTLWVKNTIILQVTEIKEFIFNSLTLFPFKPIHQHVIAKPLRLFLDLFLRGHDAFNKQISEIKLNHNILALNIKSAIHEQVSKISALLLKFTLTTKTAISQIISARSFFYIKIKQFIIDPLHKIGVFQPYNLSRKFILSTKDIVHKQVSSIGSFVIDLILASHDAFNRTSSTVLVLGIRFTLKAMRVIQKTIPEANFALLLKIKQFVKDSIHKTIAKFRFPLFLKITLFASRSIHKIVSQIVYVKRIIPFGVKEFITKSEVSNYVAKKTSYFFKTIRNINFFKTKK